MQGNKNNKKKDKEIDKLAVLPPLNQEEVEEEEGEKDKEVVILNTDGRILVQQDERNEELSKTTDSSTITDKTFVPEIYEQEQEQQLKKKINRDLKECSSCKDLTVENRELKEILKNQAN